MFRFFECWGLGVGVFGCWGVAGTCSRKHSFWHRVIASGAESGSLFESGEVEGGGGASLTTTLSAGGGERSNPKRPIP